MSERTLDVLLVHDKLEKLERYRQLLLDAGHGWDVETASCGEEAVERALSGQFFCVILDVLMPCTRKDAKAGLTEQQGGVWALERISQQRPWLPVIMFSQHELNDDIIDQARRFRIFDYLIRDEPHFAFKFVTRLKNAEEVFHNRLETLGQKSDIVYKSGRMQGVVLEARRSARSEAPVLITGETGTGKSLIAREIHRWSSRRDRTFLVMNCAALPETLVESEMFGHVEGAFTGAVKRRRGKLELADRGSIFLDEIGDMSLQTQAKLLRAIEDQEFSPVGSEEVRKVDVRIICATNKNLEQMIKEKTFRDDLYYRICYEKIEVPPLRERPEDVGPLMQHFLAIHAQKTGRTIDCDARVVQRMQTLTLRGNVRELQGILQAGLSRMERSEQALTEYHLESELFGGGASAPASLIPDRETALKAVRGGVDYSRATTDFSNALIDAAMQEAAGVGERAARMLKLNPHTLRRYVRQREGT
ncbi:MAG: sigma-54-dependent Fis family transcriptional regulator [Candidatus Brocadiae bacterium]|nr:sigma-54-dependent Fis family transcriptional regulator [Candidatus Brocadiia bacterium]